MIPNVIVHINQCLYRFSPNNGIGRFITNQQNIYRVTPVHYLQKAEKKT